MNNTILALDVNSHRIGWALFENEKLIDFGVERIRKASEDVYTAAKGAGRFVGQAFFEMEMDGDGADYVVIEEPLLVASGRNLHPVRALNLCIGAVVAVASQRGAEVHMIPVSTWRRSCGVTNRNKDEAKADAIAFAELTYGVKDITHDTADAIGVGHHFISVLPILLQEKS